MKVHRGEVKLREIESLLSRHGIQATRLGVVRRPSFALIMHVCEVVLCMREALRRCQAQKSPRLNLVRRPAYASSAHISEYVLRLSVSLRRGYLYLPLLRFAER